MRGSRREQSFAESVSLNPNLRKAPVSRIPGIISAPGIRVSVKSLVFGVAAVDPQRHISFVPAQPLPSWRGCCHVGQRMRRVVPRAIIFIAISALFIGADFLVLADRPLLREGGMPEDELAEVRDMEGNSICVECAVTKPQWASLTYGTLLCLECAGKHRGLGSQTSFVRSLTLDKWTPEQIRIMQSGGNHRFLAYCESKGLPLWLPLHLKYKSEHAVEYKKLLVSRVRVNFTALPEELALLPDSDISTRHSNRYEGVGRSWRRVPSHPARISASAHEKYEGIAGGCRQTHRGWGRGTHRTEGGGWGAGGGGAAWTGVLNGLGELWGSILAWSHKVRPLDQLLSSAVWLACRIGGTYMGRKRCRTTDSPLPGRSYPQKWSGSVHEAEEARWRRKGQVSPYLRSAAGPTNSDGAGNLPPPPPSPPPEAAIFPGKGRR
ncbi:hypothetical protein AAMO2058_000524900 [Amorphochlora amoebiformis]